MIERIRFTRADSRAQKEMNETTLVEQCDSDLVKRTQSVICFYDSDYRLAALYVYDFVKKYRLKEFCLWASLKCRSRLIGKSIYLNNLFFVFLYKHISMRMGIRVGLQCAYSCWLVSIHHVWSENRMVISPRQAQLTDCSVRHPSTPSIPHHTA